METFIINKKYKDLLITGELAGYNEEEVSNGLNFMESFGAERDVNVIEKDFWGQCQIEGGGFCECIKVEITPSCEPSILGKPILKFDDLNDIHELVTEILPTYFQFDLSFNEFLNLKRVRSSFSYSDIAQTLENTVNEMPKGTNFEKIKHLISTKFNNIEALDDIESELWEHYDAEYGCSWNNLDTAVKDYLEDSFEVSL